MTSSPWKDLSDKLNTRNDERYLHRLVKSRYLGYRTLQTDNEKTSSRLQRKNLPSHRVHKHCQFLAWRGRRRNRIPVNRPKTKWSKKTPTWWHQQTLYSLTHSQCSRRILQSLIRASRPKSARGLNWSGFDHETSLEVCWYHGDLRATNVELRLQLGWHTP